MRGCRNSAGLRSAGLKGDDGFYTGYGPCRAHEISEMTQAFDIHDNAADIRVASQIIDHIPEIHIQHGAQADHMAEASRGGALWSVVDRSRMDEQMAPLWEINAVFPGIGMR